MTSLSASKGPHRSSRANPAWATLSDEELLQIRIKDLKVSVAGTWLEDSLRDVNDELKARGIVARAHGWLSDEWFSPHDTPGIAFPFYLAHPRLARLERKMVHDVEGGTRRECMRILRHEAGHVVQYAYGLHRRRRWQTLFGRSSIPYPDHYRPNPASKNFVLHLRRWYAQCHPDEDFAETFAVWLTPRSNWRKRYADWPALEKLLYVDEMMAEIAGEKPLAKKRIEVDPISKLSMTLGEHYEKKLERYSVDAATVFDRDLKRIFSTEPRQAPLAATVIRRNRAEIKRLVSNWMGDYPLPLEAAFDDMIDRCRALQLRATGSEHKIRQDLTVLLTSHTVHAHYSSSRRQSFAV
jgi:Putative zinc-binding metallo-peptidase